jgi:hypothetical protein
MSASSIYDDYRFMVSEAGPELPEFTSQCRTVIDINDNNQGSYAGGQITFDLNQLVSSDDYLDWSSSYITIPVQLSVQGTAINPIVASEANAFAMCFKGSNLSIINSINLVCSNQQIVGNTQMSNIPLNYKILTSFNQNDVDVYGATFNFQKDSSRTFTMVAGGETNNVVGSGYPVMGNYNDVPVDLRYYPGLQNTGMQKRCLKQAKSATNTQYGTATAGTGFSTAAIQTAERIGQVNPTPGTVIVNGVSQTGVVAFNLWVQIPCKFLHDVFAKMPLHRGALWQLVISTHLNPCVFTASVDTSTGTGKTTGTTQWLPVSTNTLNSFTPFMIAAPSASNTGQAGLTVTTGASTIPANSIYTMNAQITFANAPVCILHAVTYKLNPSLSTKYMSNPRKRIVFEDFIRNIPIAMTNVGAGATVQANITPGLAKVRGLLICPFLPVANNGTQTVVSSLQSALTSAGATVTPYTFLNNFNVLIGGRPIWPKNQLYKYDEFYRENFGINAPNGNGVDALRAGLIDEDDYNAGYGFIYVNLERHLASSDDLPVSVDVIFTNDSVNIMSYNTYIFYEKEFSLDCVTGKILV